VIKQGKPGEKKRYGLYAAPFSGGACYDPADKLFKMWYTYAYQPHELGLCDTHGADESMLIKNRYSIKRPAERMAFLSEGYASPVTWSIFYRQPRWWDPVPIRHGIGTCISFADGHIEYWKWRDARTREFGEKAYALEDPDQTSYWRELQPDNEDIYRLVKAIWGRVGWE
jgi:hypothetical protein